MRQPTRHLLQPDIGCRRGHLKMSQSADLRILLDHCYVVGTMMEHEHMGDGYGCRLQFHPLLDIGGTSGAHSDLLDLVSISMEVPFIWLHSRNDAKTPVPTTRDGQTFERKQVGCCDPRDELRQTNHRTDLDACCGEVEKSGNRSADS